MCISVGASKRLGHQRQRLERMRRIRTTVRHLANADDGGQQSGSIVPSFCFMKDRLIGRFLRLALGLTCLYACCKPK